MRIKSIIAASGVLAILAAFLAVPAFAQAKPAAGGPVAPVCANCHLDQWNAIDLTAHGAKSDANGSMCQACHGDATEHLKDPMKAKPDSPFKAGVPAEKQAAVCLTCHSGNRNLAFWTSGKHAINEVACTNCHSIHGKKLTPTINKFTTTFLPEPGRPLRHLPPADPRGDVQAFAPSDPGRQGPCTDCHNPHGAISPSMVKQPTINDQCYSCHADKRGPYVFNHPPVEENCVTCHNPHGSVHYKLLNEHLPNLCEDCHDGSRHPGTIYGAGVGLHSARRDPATTGQLPARASARKASSNSGVSTRLIDRACLNCHNAIHGSNAPANRGQFFIR